MKKNVVVKPLLFEEALKKLLGKTKVAVPLTSEQWARIPAQLRDNAFFSANVQNARFLQKAKDLISDFLTRYRKTVTLPNGTATTMLKAGSRNAVVAQLQKFALEEGMGDLLPEGIGREQRDLISRTTDLGSETRMKLIVETQTRNASAYGYWKQGQSPAILRRWPAQRFIRVRQVEEPRPLHRKHEGAVRLKSDLDFWLKMNHKSIGGFSVPWGPWGFNSGMDVEDVDREEAIALGLIKKEDPPPPTPEKQFNDRLKASVEQIDPALRRKLKEKLGDALEIDRGELRWIGRPEKKDGPVTQSQKDKIKDYTGTLARRLNLALRESEETASQLKDADLISEGLHRLPKFKGNVFRWIERPQSWIDANLVRGNLLHFLAFTSSSVVKDLSGYDDRNILLSWKSESGADIENLSIIRREKEVLFDRGTLLKVIKVREIGNKVFVALEELK